VLDVQGGEHVDAGVEQLLDILVALGVARARRVGVGELVDEGEFGPPGQQRVEVHLLQHRAVIGHRAARNRLEASEQRLGLGPAVGLDHADHDVGAGLAPGAPDGEHLVGLADAGGGPEEDLEPAARPGLPARRFEQGVGRGTVRIAAGSGHAPSSTADFSGGQGRPGRGSAPAR
jgi:hypothetical protein